MKNFVVALAAILSFFSAGCGMVLETTKSTLSGISVSSPAANQLGWRTETHRLILKNRLHLVGDVMVNGKNSNTQLYPNEDLVFVSSFEPFHQAEISLALIFREADGSYAGYATRTFSSGSFARSEAWTIFASDVTYRGRRLARSPDAPEFEPRVRQLRLPREWFNGTTYAGFINDTAGKLRVTTNGAVRANSLAPGEVYAVRTRDWSSSSRWGGRQPVIVQLESWDDEGYYMGICERELYPVSHGVRSQMEAVGPQSFRRR